MLFKDEIGTYRIVCHKDGTATVKHLLPFVGWFKVGTYNSVESAKHRLACYCGGMPKEIKKNCRKKVSL